LVKERYVQAIKHSCQGIWHALANQHKLFVTNSGNEKQRQRNTRRNTPQLPSGLFCSPLAGLQCPHHTSQSVSSEEAMAARRLRLVCNRHSAFAVPCFLLGAQAWASPQAAVPSEPSLLSPFCHCSVGSSGLEPGWADSSCAASSHHPSCPGTSFALVPPCPARASCPCVVTPSTASLWPCSGSCSPSPQRVSSRGCAGGGGHAHSGGRSVLRGARAGAGSPLPSPLGPVMTDLRQSRLAYAQVPAVFLSVGSE